MQDNVRPRTQTTDPGPSSVYPPRIRLTPGAERYLEQLGADLVTGAVELDQLPPSLMQLYVFAFEQGRNSVLPALEQAKWDADRYWFEMTIRRPPPVGEYVSWADLQRRRQEREKQAAGHYPGGDLLTAWGLQQAPDPHQQHSNDLPYPNGEPTQGFHS